MLGLGKDIPRIPLSDAARRSAALLLGDTGVCGGGGVEILGVGGVEGLIS